jgi:hypothetical protein
MLNSARMFKRKVLDSNARSGRATSHGTLRKGSFWQSLLAVLAGNAIYFSVQRFLPARAQHQLYQIDWGLAVDFWICLVCYGLVRRFFRD